MGHPVGLEDDYAATTRSQVDEPIDGTAGVLEDAEEAVDLDEIRLRTTEVRRLSLLAELIDIHIVISFTIASISNIITHFMLVYLFVRNVRM